MGSKGGENWGGGKGIFLRRFGHFICFNFCSFFGWRLGKGGAPPQIWRRGGGSVPPLGGGKKNVVNVR